MNTKGNDKNCPLVSVVITTYKRDSSYLEEALESVLAQTYPRIEIIVVDDNGDDSKYSEAVKCLCDRHRETIYLKNPVNRGAQYSRNIGLLTATGDYIAFLDDDDIWEPQKIDVQMKLFDDPDVGMVYCDGYSFLDGDRDVTGTFREASLFDRPISFELELFNDYIGSTSQAIVKRECFASVGLFDTDMPARQDYEMWLRISRSFKVVGSPEKLLRYRKHSGERISTNWMKCFTSYRLILEKYSNDLAANKYSKAKLMLRLFTTAKQSGHFVIGISYFVRALMTSPRCVIDVVNRNVRKIPFSQYYDDEKLSLITANSR